MKADSKTKLFITSMSLLIMMATQGCGTIATHTASVPYPYDRGCYRGTAYDGYWFEGNNTWVEFPDADHYDHPWVMTGIGAPIMVCDLVLSIGMDTVFLPYDGIKAWSDAPPKPKTPLEQTQTYQKPLEQK